MESADKLPTGSSQLIVCNEAFDHSSFILLLKSVTIILLKPLIEIHIHTITVNCLSKMQL